MPSKIPGLNRKNGAKRQEDDFYATHPSAIAPLLALLDWQSGGKVIRENSCGQGHLSKALEACGHTVISTDLIDRGYGIVPVDFLEDHWTDHIPVDAVIMNPPFKHARKFIDKSMTLAPVVCAFLRIQFLESGKRRKFFEENPPAIVAVFSERIPTSKDARFDPEEKSATCHAWFIWYKDYKGPTIVRWI